MYIHITFYNLKVTEYSSFETLTLFCTIYVAQLGGLYYTLSVKQTRIVESVKLSFLKRQSLLRPL